MFSFKLFILEWAIALTITIVCVWIHATALNWLSRNKKANHHGQRRIFFVMVFLILIHMLEISVFAIGYEIILSEPGFGRLLGIDEATYPDYLYFSSVVYTTLGFGDITPQGLIRIYTSIESLTGLSLVAWSMSAAFIEIQQAN